MLDRVDWSHRGAYMATRHGLSVTEASEALSDPNRIVLTPDYNSESGLTTRVIGFSQSVGAIVTVILLPLDGVVYGVNGWRANERDCRIYREENQS